MKGLISLLVCCCTVAIAENSTQWIYPPGIPTTFSDPPLTYNYGDTVKVSWISTYLPIHFQGPFLDLWCGLSNLKVVHVEVLANDTRSVLLSNLDLKGSSLPIDCHWSIDYNELGNGSEVFTINKQDPNLSPTTWGIGSTAKPTLSSSSIPSSSLASATATTSPSTISLTTVTASASPRSPGLNTSAKTGIALGCVAGTLLGVAAAFGVVVFRKRRRKARNVRSEGPEKADFSEPGATFSKPELPTNEHWPQEMPLCRDTGYRLAPFELPEGRSYEELPAERLHRNWSNKLPAVSPHELPVPLPGLPLSPRPAVS